MLKVRVIIFALFVCHSLFAQNINTYTSGELISKIISDNDNIYVGTTGGLVTINRSTESTSYLNRGNSGIPDNSITTLALDKKGTLWMGHIRRGISKLIEGQSIGYNSKNSKLPFDFINDIEIDFDGNIWIGAMKYLIKFDGINFTTIETGNPSASNTNINDLATDQNKNIWVGATWGLGKVTNGKLTIDDRVKFPVLSILPYKNDLYVGTGGGLIKLSDGKQVFYNLNNSAISGNRIEEIKNDSKGNIWVATENGVSKFDGNNWVNYTFSNSPLPKGLVTAIEIDDIDNVWLSVYKNGLIKFDGNKWAKYPTSSTLLSSNYISTLSIEKSNQIWITYSDASDITTYNGTKWESFSLNDISFLDNNLKKVYQDSKKRIWVGDDIAVSLKDSVWETHNISYSQNGGKIKRDNKGTLWFAEDDGLLMFDGTNWIVFNKSNSPLPSNTIKEIAIDKNNDLWVNTLPISFEDKGTLYKYDGQKWSLIFTCDVMNWVSSIDFDSNGKLWIGIMDRSKVGKDNGGGIKSFNGQTWESYNTNNSKLPSNSVIDLTFDKSNNLYIGTYGGGLARLSNKNEWQILNMSNSKLSGDNIEKVIIDTLNNIWLTEQYSGLIKFEEAYITGTENEIIKKKIETRVYPNPFTSITSIELNIPTSENVSIKIYDTHGVLIKALINSKLNAGTHRIYWNGTNEVNIKLPKGVYISVITVGLETFTQRVII